MAEATIMNAHIETDAGPDTQHTVRLHIDNPDALGGGGEQYELPTADVSTLGGVKVSVANLGGMNAVDTYINDGVVKGRVPNAGASTPGLVKQAEAIADLSAAPTQEDFNGLLAKLRACGVLAS